jgi:dephospho-CoA kinase
MITWGLTGAVGAGKSTAATLFARRGWTVLDTDQVARELVVPGAPALEEIRAQFGSQYLTPAGALDRPALGDLVFADAEARKRLEEILHPRIRAAWRSSVEAWRASGAVPAALVVIPLLFEVDAGGDFDLTVCVGCSAASQISRLQGRGWSEPQIRQRIHSQWPLQRKMEAADVALWNEYRLEELERQIDRVISFKIPAALPGPPKG